MQILIKREVLERLKKIRSIYFECEVNIQLHDITLSILPCDDRDVTEKYIIQYGDSDDIDDHVQLFTNGFDDDKLLELMRCIKHYHPHFEWIENEE